MIGYDRQAHSGTAVWPGAVKGVMEGREGGVTEGRGLGQVKGTEGRCGGVDVLLLLPGVLHQERSERDGHGPGRDQVRAATWHPPLPPQTAAHVLHLCCTYVILYSCIILV